MDARKFARSSRKFPVLAHLGAPWTRVVLLPAGTSSRTFGHVHKTLSLKLHWKPLKGKNSFFLLFVPPALSKVLPI